MTIAINEIDFSQLTLDERTLLAFDLLESVREEAASSPVPQEYLAELHRRAAEIDAGTATLLRWDEIKARVFGRH